MLKYFMTLISLLMIPLISVASWFSEITGVDIDLNRGSMQIKPPNLNAIPQMIQSFPKDIGQAMINPAAPALATVIRFSRGQALNRGVQPIPKDIKIQLTPYFPPNILDKVRWTTANGISIDGALKNWFNQEGAVTYDDVIAFGSAGNATDVELWAHELTHVLQYAQMGVETFAFLYSVNWNQLESQARSNASRIMESIYSTQGGQASTWGYTGEVMAASMRPAWPQVSEMARQVFNPAQCIWINNQTNTAGNGCSVSIFVTGVIVKSLLNGQQFNMPCNQPTCIFQPNQSGPLLSPYGHVIVGVTAAYQQP